MLHVSETWHLQHLQGIDRVMIRQICSIKPDDVATVRSSELLAKLELEVLNLILKQRRLRWFGHVECSSGAVRKACDIYRLMAGGGREVQVNMRETDRKRLL